MLTGLNHLTLAVSDLAASNFIVICWGLPRTPAGKAALISRWGVVAVSVADEARRNKARAITPITPSA